jgi:BirA family biotin operon repressor/biotin-[acetyl-CoA-carboxylase] ligase
MTALSFASWLATVHGAPLEWPENLVACRSLDSTNRLGRTLIAVLGEDDETPAPAMLVAWEQTAGRGRAGRSWVSDRGLGLYATLLWPLPEDRSVNALPLVVAVALCEGLTSLLPEPCRLDWPNDLVVRGRKLGGILIESTSREDRAVALIGFGINLEHRDQELPAGAISLAALGTHERDPGIVLRRLAGGLGAELLEPPDSERLLARYRAASLHREGDAMSCRVGGETVRGAFAGFDPSGFLRLATAGGLRTLSSGDLVE